MKTTVTGPAPTTRSLQLELLSEKVEVITPEFVGYYKQKCMVCFHHQGHMSGVVLAVEREGVWTNFCVEWNGTLDDRMLRASAVTTRTTDDAACAIGLMLVSELTEFVAVEQSVIGTTIDYYLVRKPLDDDLIFNHAARLEVSGVLAENEANTVDARIREKQRRLEPEDGLPDLIVVVELSRPWSRMVVA